MIKKCAICENKFESKTAARTCSEECKYVLRYKQKRFYMLSYNRKPEVKAKKAEYRRKQRLEREATLGLQIFFGLGGGGADFGKIAESIEKNSHMKEPTQKSTVKRTKNKNK